MPSSALLITTTELREALHDVSNLLSYAERFRPDNVASTSETVGKRSPGLLQRLQREIGLPFGLADFFCVSVKDEERS